MSGENFTALAQLDRLIMLYLASDLGVSCEVQKIGEDRIGGAWAANYLRGAGRKSFHIRAYSDWIYVSNLNSNHPPISTQQLTREGRYKALLHFLQRLLSFHL